MTGADARPTCVVVEVRDEVSGTVLFQGTRVEPWEYIDVVRSENAPTKLFCEVSDLSALLRPVPDGSQP